MLSFATIYLGNFLNVFLFLFCQDDLTVENICQNVREQVRKIESTPGIDPDEKEAEKLKVTKNAKFTLFNNSFFFALSFIDLPSRITIELNKFVLYFTGGHR